jgi:hypothetical protein
MYDAQVMTFNNGRIPMNLPILRLALATATLCSIGLTGCTLTSTAPATPISSTVGNIRGQAFGGNVPISGAQVWVYAAGTSGYGGASTLLSPTAAVTDANGAFSVTTNYVCTVGQQVYLYAIGGNTGAGTNNNSGMLAVLGTCPASGSMASVTPFVWMNEVSTVAAAYAFAGFATDATHVSDDEAAPANTTASLAQTGMANAFANAANLVNLATGTALTAMPAAGATGVVPQSQINTIADVLAACVNTASSTTTPSTPSSLCSMLFENATSDGTTSGTMPTDTATAAINIAHHPTANVGTLYGLINGQPAFLPYAMTAAPADFTVSILYPQGGTGTVGLAIDGNGNAFATYGGGNTVYKITPAGVQTSYVGPATATPPALPNPAGIPLAPRHLAIDASNNVWVPTTAAITASSDMTITEFDDNLNLTHQYASFDTTTSTVVPSLNAIAFASNGDLWALGQGKEAIRLNSSGVFQGSITGLSTSAFDIAINPSGIIAITSGTVKNALSLYTSAGTLITSTAAGAGGMSTPQGVISDATGNFWVANNGNAITSEFTAAGVAVSANGYPTTGTVLVSGDFDGLGNYWTGGGTGYGVFGLNPSGAEFAAYTPPSTPATGASDQYFGIDGSGNIWYGANKQIGEMIGAAAPKVTPLVTATFGGKLATRP